MRISFRVHFSFQIVANKAYINATKAQQQTSYKYTAYLEQNGNVWRYLQPTRARDTPVYPAM